MYTPLHAIERTNTDNNLLVTKIHITISIKIQKIESLELETIRYCILSINYKLCSPDISNQKRPQCLTLSNVIAFNYDIFSNYYGCRHVNQCFLHYKLLQMKLYSYLYIVVDPK